jgi:ribonuclease HI
VDQQSLFGADDAPEPEPVKPKGKAAAAADEASAPAADGPMTKLVAATDGSCLRNPGPGGWCWYVNDDCWSVGGEEETTNNRMELLAVLSLLEAVPVGRPVHIMADSSYVIDACTKWRHGWKRKNWRTSSGEPVKNRDLMERLDSLMDTHTPTFEWVRGHQGHAENEAADVRARTVATSIQSGLNDWDPGPGLTC